MIHSSKQKIKKANSIFTRQVLQTLSPQQQEFANNQFRKVYAEQMSKLSAQIQREKKVKQKQQLMGAGQSKIHIQQHQKVMKKIAESDRHRQQHLKKKAQLYKLNDQRWKYKMEEIQKNIKIKNKVAMKKAEQYRHQSEEFWKNKQLKFLQFSKQTVKISDSSSIQQQSRYLKTQQSKSKIKQSQLPQIKPKKMDRRDYSRTEHNQLNHKDIDQQIRYHREKAANLQIQKQQQAIANALKKMKKIQKTRKAKMLEAKVSEPTISRKVQKSMKKIPVQRHHKSSMDKNNKQSNLNQRGSKDLLSLDHYPSIQKVAIQQDIQRHHLAKQRKQRAQFDYRGQVLEKSLKRNKKTKIMKMIKEKVYSMKMSAKIKKQAN